MYLTNDYHMHSSFSEDSDARPEDMILRACKLGLSSICFTEHLDLDYPSDAYSFQTDLPSYFSKMEQLKSIYQDKIKICTGIEFGMQKHLASRYADLSTHYPFDFIIASQHLLDDQDPYFREFWSEKNESSCYRSYFEQLLSNLEQMKDFDTLAHLDYIVRYGPDKNKHYSYSAYKDQIDPILDYLIRHDKCLEVNSAGIRYGLGHPNPEESILERYFAMGGRLITIGSDAHAPEHIACDFDKLYTILQAIGFSSYMIFYERTPLELPLRSDPISPRLR